MAVNWEESRELGVKIIIPAALTVLLMMALQIPTPYFIVSRLAPIMPFIFTYYWVIQRPEAVPLPIVFIVAILHDFWGEDLVGVTALLTLVMRMTLAPHAEVFRVAPFPLRWIAFGVLLIAMLGLKWAVMSFTHWAWVEPWDLVFQGIVTLALYPLFNHFYAIVDKRVMVR